MRLFILLAIIASYSLEASALRLPCVFTVGYNVEIISQLPLNSSDLMFHCQSKDSDLGFHNLTMDEGYKWHFCENIGHTTLFFCHFWWGADHSKQFEVFDHAMGSTKCTNGICNWIAKDDGFYFTNDFAHGTWLKMYAWDT